jgi:hypothetical protein
LEKEEVTTEQINNRSIQALIQGYLCPKCAQKLKADKKYSSPDALMAAIQTCCSRTPGFINDRLPILESVFRLFLSNGNQSLNLEELGKQLSILRGGDAYRTLPETLSRLLKSDRYYGLQEVQN